MSILVKDMEMPKCCDECRMRQINLAHCQIMGRSTSHTPSGYELDQHKRPGWCPLVEVTQPHGRLIDADGFEKVMNDKLLPLLIAKYGEEEAMRGMHFSFRDSICNIQAQPTVIEREGT